MIFYLGSELLVWRSLGWSREVLGEFECWSFRPRFSIVRVVGAFGWGVLKCRSPIFYR